jgi:glycosyltransferase involved in cell wall biosynthesis
MSLVEPNLVTVVIPAYNAARTIDETLRSVRCQTHSRLEILVVDDGSEDETEQIVRRHAAEDRRVRLIRQPRSGVAAARNRGIAEAAGDFVSPIDADDLWRPRNIEKQLAALRQSGDGVALVYNWCARIDADSRIIYAVPRPTHTGTVLNEIFRGNFPGNGSTVLMRKEAIVEAGGYDPSLRARSGEGSEDWQLYFRIATRHQFAVVPEHLTGYRRTDNSMSANLLQMLRGRDLVAEEMCQTYPDHAIKIKGYRLYFLEYLYYEALHTRQTINILRIAVLLVNESPLRGAALVVLQPLRFLARLVQRRLMRLVSMGVHGSNQAESRRFLGERR